MLVVTLRLYLIKLIYYHNGIYRIKFTIEVERDHVRVEAEVTDLIISTECVLCEVRTEAEETDEHRACNTTYQHQMAARQWMNKLSLP
jgi:hypothetical protein